MFLNFRGANVVLFFHKHHVRWRTIDGFSDITEILWALRLWNNGGFVVETTMSKRGTWRSLSGSIGKCGVEDLVFQLWWHPWALLNYTVPKLSNVTMIELIRNFNIFLLPSQPCRIAKQSQSWIRNILTWIMFLNLSR